MDWFPRRHAVVLARSSPGRLAYLEKIGMVVPQRTGHPPRLEVLYSWEQVLEIRAIGRLRRHLSFQAIRRITHYFEEHGFAPSLRDKHLIINRHGVSWMRSDTPVPQVIHLVGQGEDVMGQFVLSPLDLAEPTQFSPTSPAPLTKVVSLEQFRQRVRPR